MVNFVITSCISSLCVFFLLLSIFTRISAVHRFVHSFGERAWEVCLTFNAPYHGDGGGELATKIMTVASRVIKKDVGKVTRTNVW